MTKYVFILGGVVSSLGKGIASAAIGSLLKARGYSVHMHKIDPYLNVDPGAMSPYQHGEVFVTADGAETDLDLGHYERFTDVECHKTDSISGGRIYFNVLEKERQGAYKGGTVQAIPHVSNEIKDFIRNGANGEDFALYEIGGTVGDIEGMLMLEAIRQFANEVGRENVCVVFLTLLPYIETAGELKTKPTQHAVRTLLEAGIQADILLCRSKTQIPEEERRKLALFCNVKPADVVAAMDVDNIYKIPLAYHEQGLDTQVLAHFGMLEGAPEPNLTEWQDIVYKIAHFEKETHVAVVGKYWALPDAYKSLGEALQHAGIANNVKVKIHWLDAERLENLSESEVATELAPYDGILVPGGCGVRGAEGKIRAIRYAREKNVPFLGVCLGFQMAVVEACRNLLGIENANSSEFGVNCTPVVAKFALNETEGAKSLRADEKANTLRRGSFQCILKADTIAAKAYGKLEIAERHRNTYEADKAYAERLAEKGVLFSGMSPDGLFPEILEMPAHKFFVACQFHPEFASRPARPTPLVSAFVAALTQK